MTTELTLNNANIEVGRGNLDRFVVMDKDVFVFGTGETYPEALRNLANNYPEEYQRDE